MSDQLLPGPSVLSRKLYMWLPELPSAHPPLSPDLDNLRSAWATRTKLGSGLFSGSMVPLLTVPLASYVPCLVPRFPVRVPLTSGSTTAATTRCESVMEAQLAAGEEGHRGMAGTVHGSSRGAALTAAESSSRCGRTRQLPVCLLQPTPHSCSQEYPSTSQKPSLLLFYFPKSDTEAGSVGRRTVPQREEEVQSCSTSSKGQL